METESTDSHFDQTLRKLADGAALTGATLLGGFFFGFLIYRSLRTRPDAGWPATGIRPLAVLVDQKRISAETLDLLRRSAAHLHFRRQIGVHQCRAPVRRRTNLLRGDS
jgi:hypothetical protein